MDISAEAAAASKRAADTPPPSLEAPPVKKLKREQPQNIKSPSPGDAPSANEIVEMDDDVAFDMNKLMDNPATVISDVICKALDSQDTETLSTVLLSIMGFDKENPPPRSAASLLTKAALRIEEAAHQATMERIKAQQQNTRHTYFGRHTVNVDSIVEMTGFLSVTDKYMLGSLSRSWKYLMNSQFMWHSLDPMPVSNFSKYAEIKLFLTQNEQKFRNCKILQLPRVPSSSKLFKDLFACMPQLRSLSLHNVTGSGPLRQLVVAATNPERLLQLSFGLLTKVTPAEVVNALKHFGNFYLFIYFYPFLLNAHFLFLF
jgi:hypothetical protein